MMYKPDDERIEEAVEETGILQESDVNESAQEIEDSQEAPPETPAQEE